MAWRLRIEIAEGALIPQWYGIAYRAWDRNAAICYPLPLNWLVRWCRDLLRLLKIPPWSVSERRLKVAVMQARADAHHNAYGEGYRDGHRRGFDDGLATAREETAAIAENILKRMQAL